MTAGRLVSSLAAGASRLVHTGDRVYAEHAAGDGVHAGLEPLGPDALTSLAEALKTEILAAVAVAPEQFDRDRYDALWAGLRVVEAALAAPLPDRAALSGADREGDRPPRAAAPANGDGPRQLRRLPCGPSGPGAARP
jgi:hypothetical protein